MIGLAAVARRRRQDLRCSPGRRNALKACRQRRRGDEDAAVGGPRRAATCAVELGDVNDRPAGVGRNSARGAAQWTTNIRFNKSIPLGGVRSGPPNLPVPPPPPQASRLTGQQAGGNAMAQRVGGGGPGGDGPQMVVMEANNARYRLDIYANVMNAFSNVNYNAFIGNQLSPFVGTATSAAAPRRIELGFSLGF
jgi:hypothetical protein